MLLSFKKRQIEAIIIFKLLFGSDNMEENIYQELRERLEKLLDDENQNLSWKSLDTFTQELSNVRQDGFKLYRYSPADYYNIRNFETGRLRLTDNGRLNDIYEGLPIFDTNEIDKLQMLRDCAYIKCFSEQYNSSVMWAHYADNHRGICVEYDLSLLDGEDEVLPHIFPVLYVEGRPFSGEAALEICDSQKWLNNDIFHNAYPSDAEILDDALLMFLFKGEEWKPEREWRILYSKHQLYNRSASNIIDQTISFDCATAIYLGARIEPEISKNITEIVERINRTRQSSHKPKIQIYRITPGEQTYTLCSKPIGGT